MQRKIIQQQIINFWKENKENGIESRQKEMTHIYKAISVWMKVDYSYERWVVQEGAKRNQLKNLYPVKLPFGNERKMNTFSDGRNWTSLPITDLSLKTDQRKFFKVTVNDKRSIRAERKSRTNRKSRNVSAYNCL